LSDNGLDLTSRRILQILGTDGRSSYQAIADEVGLSRPAVMERVKRLEEAGYITGYAARLDRARLGLPITAFVAVRYSSGADAHEEAALTALERHPNVLECHHVAGEDCFVLKVAAPTIDSLEKLIREMKGQGHGVTTRTTIVLSTVFEKPGIIPVESD
jgi:Lrp/AsnC family transcriptional regulator, leucine-responsive regulatory protein